MGVMGILGVMGFMGILLLLLLLLLAVGDGHNQEAGGQRIVWIIELGIMVGNGEGRDGCTIDIGKVGLVVDEAIVEQRDEDDAQQGCGTQQDVGTTRMGKTPLHHCHEGCGCQGIGTHQGIACCHG